jgi:hypothetical protein
VSTRAALKRDIHIHREDGIGYILNVTGRVDVYPPTLRKFGVHDNLALLVTDTARRGRTGASDIGRKDAGRLALVNSLVTIDAHAHAWRL